MKKYSDEILYLKEQNKKLINNLNIMNLNNENKIANNEAAKREIIYQQEMSNFDNFINEFAKEINEELYVISQWIETYLSNDYDKNYEIPSLINDSGKIKNCRINLINFNLIKSSLEKSSIQLNDIISKKENEIINLKNIIKEKENQFNELKKDCIKLKEKLLELNNRNDELKIENEEGKKISLNNKKILDNIRKDGEKNNINNLNYLMELYKIIENEIDIILSDENFKVYHNNLINLKQNDKIYHNDVNINYLEKKLNNLLTKFIEIVELLKFDYIELKKENSNILNSKSNFNQNILKENYGKEIINNYKRKMNELINENHFLNEQISTMNKYNDLNLVNDELTKYSNIQKENRELRINNDNLINKMKIMNDNYMELSNKNNQLNQTIKEIKNTEKSDFILTKRINELSKDYQRILKENDSLKFFINKQNLTN
jgi:hypothetical protein